MRTKTFAEATNTLKDLKGQRVWSLMISLFGDLARREGDVINGPVLSAIMAAMDVRPEAARVALHRLRKDNWIASEKHGRISRHSLTREGRSQSQAASPRIYARPEDLDQSWQMVMTEDIGANALEQAGFTVFLPRCYVGPASSKTPVGAVILAGHKVPEWMKLQLEPAQLADSYDQLAQALDHTARTLPPATDLTPLEIAALRCLIVHNWRRLALKHPPLPRPLMRDEWPGLKAHVLVADLLTRYPRPDLSQISAV